MPSSPTRCWLCYRYYTCVNAQKRGWQVCPSKSIPSAEIEATATQAHAKNLCGHASPSNAYNPILLTGSPASQIRTTCLCLASHEQARRK
ncbi:MAG: hypothetical protein ACRELF_03170 [Gemmataceae bacterium]